MADPGDMQRLREALAEKLKRQGVTAYVNEHTGSLCMGYDRNAVRGPTPLYTAEDVLNAADLLAEEGWVVPQSQDGASRSVTDSVTPVGERTATPLATAAKMLYTMLAPDPPLVGWENEQADVRDHWTEVANAALDVALRSATAPEEVAAIVEDHNAAWEMNVGELRADLAKARADAALITEQRDIARQLNAAARADLSEARRALQAILLCGHLWKAHAEAATALGINEVDEP